MQLSPIEYISNKPKKAKPSQPFVVKIGLCIICFFLCFIIYKVASPRVFASETSVGKHLSLQQVIASEIEQNTTSNLLVSAALQRTKEHISYDPAYYDIDYPMGDVPANKGVCTDVLIRSFREIGIDLQQLVHEDMAKNFSSYPTTWQLKGTDRNIDHRRVPNLQTFFTRKGQSLTISQNPEDYKPGDIVVWQLSHGAPHIGLVVPSSKKQSTSPYIVHNIGGGPQWEDKLFSYKIVGHYRYGID